MSRISQALERVSVETPTNGGHPGGRSQSGHEPGHDPYALDDVPASGPAPEGAPPVVEREDADEAWRRHLRDDILVLRRTLKRAT